MSTPSSSVSSSQLYCLQFHFDNRERSSAEGCVFHLQGLGEGSFKYLCSYLLGGFWRGAKQRDRLFPSYVIHYLNE